MIDEISVVTLQVTSVLEEMSIPYVIGGSLASTLYGVARTTIDVDIVADLQVEQVPTFVARFQTTFYVAVEAVIDAIIHRTAFNMIHLATMYKVDIFIPSTRVFDTIQLENGRRLALVTDPPHYVNFAGPEDTVLAKLEWFQRGNRTSNQQWRDVIGVLQAQGQQLDQDYMRIMAHDLEVSDLLEDALAEAGLGAIPPSA